MTAKDPSTPDATPEQNTESTTEQNTAPASAGPAQQPGAATLPPLTARQQQLLSAARQIIEAAPPFQALSGPTFDHAEVTPGLSETERGYLYLRYRVPGGTPQEFWAHVGAAAGVKWKSGQVSVALG